MSVVVESLVKANFLPDTQSAARHWRIDETARLNLLPGLITAWQTAADTTTVRGGRSRAAGILSWLTSQLANGACLTWGIPHTNAQTSVRWLGARLAWWPQGVPGGRRIGLVSSRLGKKLELRDEWFRLLRASCSRLDARHDRLVSAGSTTTARFVERCATLFHMPLMCIETEDRTTLARWAKRIRRMPPSPDGPATHHVYLSPCLSERKNALLTSRREWMFDVPTRDRALCLICEQLIVLHLRRHGNLHRLIRERLGDSYWPVASVRLALGKQLVSRELAQELMDRGAVGWLVLNPRPSTKRAPLVAPADPAVSTPSSVGAIGQSGFQLPRDLTEGYLTHCTRRRDGPWPGQRESEYYDDLILSRKGTDRSALAAMKRILSQRRLVASATTIRGGTAAVSFTAVPLDELHRLRVFRPHRTRWDFQPYGICIRRDWLESRGARAVCYATEAQWSRMSVTERPFFQVDASRGRSSAKPIDWTVEQEWRHIGDVLLRNLPADAAFVFVPSPAEAKQLEPISGWPVIVFPREDERAAIDS